MTKDIVVDENYPGLVDGGWCWKLAGSLRAEGSLTINLSKWLIVGKGIEAGWGIKAGYGIKAGCGIKAGLTVVCKKVLFFKYHLFAGVAMGKKATAEESVVSCLRIAGGGEVKHGILRMIGQAPAEPNEGGK